MILILLLCLYGVGLLAGLCITGFGVCLGGRLEMTWETAGFIAASILWPIVVPIVCIVFIIKFLYGC